MTEECVQIQQNFPSLLPSSHAEMDNHLRTKKQIVRFTVLAVHP